MLVRVRTAMHQMVDACLVAATKSMPIGISVASMYRRMPVFIPIFNAGRPVIFIVLACPSDAVMEALRLCTLNIRWYGSPWFMPVIWPISRRRRPLLQCARSRY